MGGGLRYGGGRPIFFTVVLAVLYFFILPGNWPEPAVEASVPPGVSLGEDLLVDVTVRAWHPNFNVRQISFSVRSVSSTALVDNTKPFVPITLFDEERTVQWQVGFGKRATWPRSGSFRLTVPFRKLALEKKVRPGELQGSIDVVVDYTKVTTSGYPPLTATSRIPFTLSVRR